ncbi:hypothetical protein chiPu_0025644, partial [Chiloscyllium punctatum]|nr:hypothetical protein [Chiloscyllium punctatum]
EAATNGDFIQFEALVVYYFSKCVDNVTVSRAITSHPNQKPWMTTKVCALLRTHDTSFRADDKTGLITARVNLTWAIKETKRARSQRIHSHFQDSSDTQRVWKGIQTITNHRTASPACACVGDVSLPDELNTFYARV